MGILSILVILRYILGIFGPSQSGYVVNQGYGNEKTPSHPCTGKKLRLSNHAKNEGLVLYLKRRAIYYVSALSV